VFRRLAITATLAAAAAATLLCGAVSTTSATATSGGQIALASMSTPLPTSVQMVPTRRYHGHHGHRYHRYHRGLLGHLL
jgi:hypothetical protein